MYKKDEVKMKILSIDTASEICSVAILENTTCIKEISINDARNHSEKIMPIIEQVLTESKLTLQNIDLCVCNKGPGSFTGIRIGIATSLAFRDSLNITCVGIDSLESLAHNFTTLDTPSKKSIQSAESVQSSESVQSADLMQSAIIICSLIDAKNNNVYLGLYELKNNEYIKIIDPCFMNINDAIHLLSTYYDLTNTINFVGDGSIMHKNILAQCFPKCSFARNNQLSSYSLGIAGFESFKKGIQTTLIPLYLRKSQAERALEEKSKKE